MGQIAQIFNRDKDVMGRLLQIWESSVKETHTFLSADDIKEIIPDVKAGLVAVEHLYGYFIGHQIYGFIGVQSGKIEMLFIDSNTRGQGIGRQLLTYASQQLKARYVDVNEQNTQGVGFYEHMGFTCIGRSNIDGQGRPFPILHLEKL